MTDLMHIAPSQTQVHRTRLSEDQAAGHLSEDQAAGHLSEDQLDDCLIGDLAAAPAAHLAACPLCRQRVAEAGRPLASFGAVSLAWAERVSATSPVPSIAAARTAWERRLSWSMALATCAVAMGIITAGYGFAGLGFAGLGGAAAGPGLAQSASSASVAGPSTEQVSNDNRLLRTIDLELAASESPAALGLVSSQATTRVRVSGAAGRYPLRDLGQDSIRD